MMKTFTLITLTIFLILLLGACVSAPSGDSPSPESVPSIPPSASRPLPETPDPADGNTAAELEEILPTRTPDPTSTPDSLAQGVDEFVQGTRLDGKTYGPIAEIIINLVISLLIVIIAYLIGYLMSKILQRLIGRRTSAKFAYSVNQVIGPNLRLLVALFGLRIATDRLEFLSFGLKTLLNDIYFVALVVLGAIIAWNLVELLLGFYKERATADERRDELDPMLLLLTRVGRIIIIMVGLGLLFCHFGLSNAVLLVAFGIGGLAFSFAAQDTLADAIAGFIILIDRPYRIGDRVEIQSENTWGDVVKIGLRTTRIATRDNRMVIVPNSMISKNQIVNYPLLGKQHRMQTFVGIAYGMNVETTRRVIVDAVRRVDGVLLDEPIEALYIERGDSSRNFRVRFWIEDYTDSSQILDKVNAALEEALDVASIETPYPTQRIQLELDPKAMAQLSQALREQSMDG